MSNSLIKFPLPNYDVEVHVISSHKAVLGNLPHVGVRFKAEIAVQLLHNPDCPEREPKLFFRQIVHPGVGRTFARRMQDVRP
ncbi:hypothetical protein AVEN_259307-1 [Araneus ventricosus]|uniref:Uncharacterized protein n=1 Tax=Araneus ventricosus TaxID=182803 RepID=A0A4Y2GI78_ARAVE|nr:hypothetical protein AVEN_259307-1 [Araneus ventricosus]